MCAGGGGSPGVGLLRLTYPLAFTAAIRLLSPGPGRVACDFGNQAGGFALLGASGNDAIVASKNTVKP